MGKHTEIFVGIDVAKNRTAIAVADGDRDGEVRFIGEIDTSNQSMREAVDKIIARHKSARFCYEAWLTGYDFTG